MHNFLRYSIIAFIAALLFIPFLGHVHLFDWDEINFAECAREMVVSKDYLRMQIDFKPFWEKPPLFIWMQVLAMKCFGVNEFAARVPNACVGIATLLILYYAGKRVLNEKMALWWVLLYASCWLPHFYFKSGIIDPLFNLFIFLSFFQFYLIKYGRNKIVHGVLTGLFVGLAVLTKGPVAILISILSLAVYAVVNRGLKGYSWSSIVLIILVSFCTLSIWFGIEIWAHGWWFVNEFISYQVRLFQTEDAGHGGAFYYHFIVLLIGCFPASVFLFQRNKESLNKSGPDVSFTRLMWVMFWVVLILFSVVKTKIVHYSSLCYFPLTYLGALQLYRLAEGHVRLRGYTRILMFILGVFWAILLIAIPAIGVNKAQVIPYIHDAFAVGNLNASVPWSYMECAWGVVYLFAMVICIVLMNRNFKRYMLIFCVSQIVFIQLTILHFTPKIEAYSQRAAINFFENMQGKDVYVQVLGYKSYAHLFYTGKMPPGNDDYYSTEWLLNGPVDKPTYFVCKITDAEQYKTMAQLQMVGQQNGFVFFKRK